MKKVVSSALLALVILAIVVGSAIFLKFRDSSTNKSTIEFIASHIDYKNEIVDWQNELGYEDESSVQFFANSKKCAISFGKMYMEWEIDDFITKEVQDQLATIGIVCYYNKQKDIVVYYRGVKLEEYVL